MNPFPENLCGKNQSIPLQSRQNFHKQIISNTVAPVLNYDFMHENIIFSNCKFMFQIEAFPSDKDEKN